MRRNQELSAYAAQPMHEESDKDADSESPIIDAFRTADGPRAFLKMINSGEAEFDAIRDPLSDYVASRWNAGPG